MIQIEHLHVEEFRGIREIDLDFASKTFVVHGPNGSGKSGIVDAIDFVLTGTIQRLSGSGTGGITLSTHGPHVHKRDNPRAARVALRFKVTKDGTVATITRSVANPRAITIEPDTPEIRDVVVQVQAHPELTLSRREIMKFVVSQPADRAREVQTLLRLNRLDEYRKLLRTVQTRATNAMNSASTEVKTAQGSFMSHLDIAQLTPAEVGRAINAQRKVLDLDAIDPITPDSDFTIGVVATISDKAVNLKSAILDAETFQNDLGAQSDLDDARQEILTSLEPLREDENLLTSLKHRSLATQGLALIDSPDCPLCGTTWDSESELKRHIESEIRQASEAQELSKAVTDAAATYKRMLREVRDHAERVGKFASARNEEAFANLVGEWRDSLLQSATGLDTIAGVLGQVDELAVPAHRAPRGLDAALRIHLTGLRAEPDQTATGAAVTFLNLAKDRWNQVIKARAALGAAQEIHGRASAIYDTYCTVSDEKLADLYKTVEQNFSDYYRAINSDDEGAFSAELAPSAGSLGLEVDFYGLGMFPPTAYHSEGHQDGMGVCLYLALVRQLLGDDFRLAILDDVVMSVDVNHRRQFCELLKREFPNVQFIITTHDEVWARQMQSAGLIGPKSQARFYGWTVDGGPLYEQGDIWGRIEDDLKVGDVAGAAHKLRRRLEAASADIAEAIGGRVTFRGDASYDLGELISSVKGRHNELLKLGANSANSWNNETAKANIQTLKAARAAALIDHEGEAWLVNKLIHNNDWAQAGVADFRPVLESSRAFLDLFTCTNDACTGWIHVEGKGPDALRCDCGTYSVNLKPKPSGR